MKKLIQNSPRGFLLIAAMLWFGLYKTLEPFSYVLVNALPLESGSHSYRALQFFFYASCNECRENK